MAVPKDLATPNPVVTIGRERVICALNWRPTAGMEEMDPRTEARHEAKTSGAKFGLLFENEHSRRDIVGLVSPLTPGRIRGAVSAAAWIADVVDKPTLYIESLGGGSYWVLAASKNEIDHRTDIIADGDVAGETIQAVLSDVRAEGNEVDIFLSDERRYPTTPIFERFPRSQRTLQEILKGSKPPTNARIDQLVGVKPTTIAAVVTFTCMLAATWGGWKLYQDHLEEQRLQVERDRIMREHAQTTDLRAAEDIAIADAVLAAAREYTATPHPMDVVEACMDGYARYPRVLANWTLQSVDCDVRSGSARAVYAIVPIASAMPMATFEDLATAAQQALGIAPAFDYTQRRATLVLAPRRLEPREALKPIQLPRSQPVANALASRLQLASYSLPSVTQSFRPPEAAPIVFRDPAAGQDRGPAMKAVPPDRGFRLGSAQLNGRELWTLRETSFTEPYVTITKLNLRITPSTTEWSLEIQYVTAAT